MSLSNRNRRLSVAPMAHLEQRGRGSLGGGGSSGRISHSFLEGSHFIQGAHPFFGLLPQFHPGQGFGAGSGVSAPEGSYRVGSTSFSRLLQPSFCSDESLMVLAAGDRPFLTKSQGVEDTIQDGDYPVHSVVSPQRDWMVSIDLKDAYLQVPIHPDSRRYLRFMAFNKVYQFKVLCFSLSTAPQIFTRVMAPVSIILHSLGIRLRLYLDDWLIQASSREQVLLSLRTVLQLCNSLGIVVNWEKSQLVPTQRLCYLRVLLDSVSFRASPAQKRVDKLLSIGDVFLSSVEQPAKSWLELLGVLSSLTQLIPGGWLRMRSFQFLHRHWDRRDPDALIRWSPEIERDLLWWLDRERLELGVSLVLVSPQLDLWSDASDVGWGAHLGGQVVSGPWSQVEAQESVNQRELLAIFYALQHFLPLVRNTSVAVFSDNTTALAYLRNQVGTRSAVLNRTAQDLLR